MRLRPPDRWQWLTAGALLGALALRLWGIGFSGGVPRGRPDEECFLAPALTFFSATAPYEMLRRGWPDGFVLLCHLLERAQAFLTGAHLGCLYALRPLSLELPVRVFSALADTAGCLLVGLLARRLAPPGLRGPALPIGALALGCNYLAARDAHFGVTDAALATLVAATLLACVRAVQDGPRTLWVAGACAGAAFAFKYSAAMLLAPCLLAAALCLARDRRALRAPALAVAAALAAFLLLSPHALLDPRAFWAGLNEHRGRFGEGGLFYLIDPDAALPPAGTFHAGVTLPAAFGIAGLGAALFGLLLAARRAPREAAVLLAALAAFFAVLMPSRELFVRYAAPLVPPLAAGLAVALTEACGWVPRAFPAEARRGVLALLFVLALAPPLARTVAFDRVLSETDTREQAAALVLERGGALAPVSSYAEPVPALPQELIDACREALPPGLFRPVPPLAIASAGEWRALVSRGREGWSALADAVLKLPAAPPLAGARWAAVTRPLLECGREGKSAGPPPPSPCWSEEAVFTPGTPACGSYVDLFDSFYVPYGDFVGAERPGPLVRLYRNRCE